MCLILTTRKLDNIQPTFAKRVRLYWKLSKYLYFLQCISRKYPESQMRFELTSTNPSLWKSITTFFIKVCFSKKILLSFIFFSWLTIPFQAFDRTMIIMEFEGKAIELWKFITWHQNTYLYLMGKDGYLVKWSHISIYYLLLFSRKKFVK